MGKFQQPYDLNEAKQVRFPEGVCIAATPEALAGLDGIQDDFPVEQVSLGIDESLPSEIVMKASVIVLQADPSSPGSMQRIANVRAKRPYMPLIVALHNADLRITRSLVREGVNDVVSLPFDRDQLVDALLDASIGAEETGNKALPIGNLYSVVGSTGGCGATTVATHLVSELAEQSGESCCLLDLDVQFGTAGAYLGVETSRTLGDLLDAGSRLDADLFNGISHEIEHNVRIVPAPHEILPVEQIDLDQVLEVIRVSRANSRNVVVDLPHDFTNWSVSEMLRSTIMLMVVELNLQSLRQARRKIDLLVDMGFDRTKIQIIVNRTEKGLFKTIRLGDVETTLKAAVLGSLPDEPSVLGPAQDQGMLAHHYQTSNRFSKDMSKLVQTLLALVAEE